MVNIPKDHQNNKSHKQKPDYKDVLGDLFAQTESHEQTIQKNVADYHQSQKEYKEKQETKRIAKTTSYINTGYIHQHLKEIMPAHIHPGRVFQGIEDHINDGNNDWINKQILKELTSLQDVLAKLLQTHYLHSNGQAKIHKISSLLRDMFHKEWNQVLSPYSDLIIDMNDPHWINRSNGFVKGALAHAFVLETLTRRTDSYEILPHMQELDLHHGCDILVHQKRPNCLVAIDITAKLKNEDNKTATLIEQEATEKLQNAIRKLYPDLDSNLTIKYISLSPNMVPFMDYNNNTSPLIKETYARIGQALKQWRIDTMK